MTNSDTRLQRGGKSAEKPPRITTTVQPAGAGKQKNFEEKLRNVKKLKKTDSVRSEIP